MTSKGKENFTNTLFFKLGLFVLGGVIVWMLLNFNSIQKVTSRSNIESGKKFTGCSEVNAIEQVKNSVVKIESEEGTGTGFLFNGPNKERFIITNYHVVRDIESPRIIYSDKSPAVGKLFNWDEQTDLAIIKINREDISGLEFGESNDLQNGQILLSIGYPYGSVLPGEAAVNKGALAARRESDSGGVEYLQVDISLNPGNSGSPVVDQCGKVMGIATVSISEGQGLNFAVAARTAKTMINSLISTGPRAIDKEKFKIADSSILAGAVFKYYDYISTRQLNFAFDLLSEKMQREVGGRDSFTKGFSNTLNVFLQEVKPIEVNTVFVKLFSVDLIGEKVLFRSFSGTWQLREIDGIWKLNEANITED